MAIAMCLSNKTTGEDIYSVPVSFMSVFKECWLPLGEKLGLDTIPLYDGALVARQGETEPIIDDLFKLRDYLLENPDQPYAQYMVTNIETLMGYLAQIEDDPNLEGWFG